MLNLNYDFGKKKKPETFWMRFGRPALLFTAIGAVTAGGIWLIVPKSSSPKPETVVQPPPETDKKPEAEKPPEAETPPEQSKPWSSPAPASDVPETKLPQEKPEAVPGKEAETTAKEEKKSALDEPIPEPSEDTPDPLTPVKEGEKEPPAENIVYDKGRVVPGDPPPEQDQPKLVPAQADLSPRFAELEAQISAKEWEKAAAGAEKILRETPQDSANYLRAGKLLGKVRWAQLSSGKTVDSWSRRYEIRPGDALSRIAHKEKTSVEQLKCSSRLRGDRIFVGGKLTVWPGPWNIEIVKESRLLKLYNHARGEKRLFGVYEVGIGRLNKTPSAEFVISFKEKHPTWYAPDGKVFKYGETGNVLGDYFLKLAPVQTPDKVLRGYGIHGTDDESTVGRSLSNGCIRMRNAEVAQLYTIVPVRTPVRIVEKSPVSTGEK